MTGNRPSKFHAATPPDSRNTVRHDLLAGFLVFLIALPLCLGISLACGYPPLAGIFTAIIGSILTTFISNSELTIKGPAAGLIVIAVGCIEAFGGDGAVGGFTAADMTAYRMALAVGVWRPCCRSSLGCSARASWASSFRSPPFTACWRRSASSSSPSRFPVALGVEAQGEPLELLRRMPEFVLEANPAIALIGCVSMLIMFLWPLVREHGPAC